MNHISKALFCPLIIICLMAQLFSPFTQPRGVQVNGGQATINSSANNITIKQTSDKTVIDWSSFNISSSETVQFVQPSAFAITLILIHASNASTINGHLLANGNVWLFNPNGVMFGRSAQVNVGGLLTTTSSITNNGFMAGNYHFTPGNNPNASISNAGNITVAHSGLVAFMAPHVINHGTINANGGEVDFTATTTSSAVTSAINDDGMIEANSLGKNKGIITLYAEGSNAVANNVTTNKGIRTGSSTVNVSGIINAQGVNSGETGGEISVLADNVNINNGATIDASGNAGGGTIKVGGDFHGRGTTPTALSTTIQANTSINADATNTGNGGNVTVWSDRHTTFAGFISVKGGINGGNGGFAEVSGHNTLDFTGLTDLTASKRGDTGTLLLDPTDLFLTLDGEAPDDNTSVVSIAVLQDLLSINNVTLSTPTSGTQSGNITIDSALAWSSGNTLKLEAANSIYVDAPITINNSGGLILNTNYQNTGGSGALYFNGGNVSFTGGTGLLKIDTVAYTLVSDLGTLAADITNAPGGHYALAQNIDASNGGTVTYAGSPIPTKFAGTFEGLGNTVSNLTINNTSGDEFVGLFSQIGANGIIRNLGLPNVNISTLYTYNGQVTPLNGGSAVGALVAYSMGTVIRDYSTGTLNVGQDFGDGNGIVGANTAGGGLVGFNQGTINQSYSGVNINGAGTVGSLVGVNIGTISNSYATGTVWGWNAGGLVGYNLTGPDLGFGKKFIGQISNSYATGDANGFFPDGGFVAYNTGTITSSYATGNVDWADNNSIIFSGGIPDFELGGGPGGFVGRNDYNNNGTSTGTITNSSASGQVYTDCCNAGTFVGYSFATLNNDSSSQTGPAVGYGNSITSGDPTLIATPGAGVLPVGFNNSIWNIQSAQANPTLVWQQSFNQSVSNTSDTINAGQFASIGLTAGTATGDSIGYGRAVVYIVGDAIANTLAVVASILALSGDTPAPIYVVRGGLSAAKTLTNSVNNLAPFNRPDLYGISAASASGLSVNQIALQSNIPATQPKITYTTEQALASDGFPVLETGTANNPLHVSILVQNGILTPANAAVLSALFQGPGGSNILANPKYVAGS